MTSTSPWSPRSALDAGASSFSLAGGLAAGAGLGLLWGVAARLWMRLVSDSPEFTLRGTGYVLGAALAVGAFVGAGLALRRRGGRWSRPAGRVLAVAGFLPLAAGPGMAMVLTSFLGSLALSRGGWHPALRAALALGALGPVWPVALDVLGDWPVARGAVSLALYFALLYPMVLGMRVGLVAPPAGRAAFRPLFRLRPRARYIPHP